MPDYVDILAKYWTDAANRLQELILHPSGSQSSPWNQARYHQQLARCIEELKNLKRLSADWTGKAVSKAVLQGEQAAVDQMNFFKNKWPGAFDTLQPNFHIIDRRALDVLARDTAANTYSDMSRAIDRTEQTVRSVLRKMASNDLVPEQVNAAIAKGVITGDKAQVFREIRQQLRNVQDGKITVPTKNGGEITFTADGYANMVANTRMREATRLSRHDRLQEIGLDLVIVVGRNSVNPCTFALGHVYSLSGKDPDYPALSSVPKAWRLFHPLCSKSTAPFIKGLKSQSVLDAVKTDPDDPANKIQNAKTAERAFKDLQGQQSANTRTRSIVEDIRRRAQAAGYEPPPWSPTKQQAREFADSRR